MGDIARRGKIRSLLAVVTGLVRNAGNIGKNSKVPTPFALSAEQKIFWKTWSKQKTKYSSAISQSLDYENILSYYMKQNAMGEKQVKISSFLLQSTSRSK